MQKAGLAFPITSQRNAKYMPQKSALGSDPKGFIWFLLRQALTGVNGVLHGEGLNTKLNEDLS